MQAGKFDNTERNEISNSYIHLLYVSCYEQSHADGISSVTYLK